MEKAPTLELPDSLVADPDDRSGPVLDSRAIVMAGSWMAILGTVRLVIALADYATAYREALEAHRLSALQLASFLRENPPLYLLIGAWPLALGLLVRQSRWHELVKAGALTFLILSIGGVMTAMAEWGHGMNRWIAIGSFHVSRGAVMRLAPAGVAMALAGSLQLLLELATGVGATALALRGRTSSSPGDERDLAGKRSRLGRVAVYVSIAFLLLTVRLPAWSAYLELLNQSRLIREFILREDLARIRAAPVVPPAESQWLRDGRPLFNEALRAWSEKRYGKARDDYSRLVELIDAAQPASMSPAERQMASEAFNNLAWLLATCPDREIRSPALAVTHAHRALEIEPNNGNTWNTLGVAYFRLENWEESRSALYRSMELRNEGDSFDWFFLSMIHARLGRKERAREWYDKAVLWSNRYRPGDEELFRFQTEAAQALGLPAPTRVAAPPSPNGPPRAYPPSSPRGLRNRNRGSRLNDQPGEVFLIRPQEGTPWHRRSVS